MRLGPKMELISTLDGRSSMTTSITSPLLLASSWPRFLNAVFESKGGARLMEKEREKLRLTVGLEVSSSSPLTTFGVSPIPRPRVRVPLASCAWSFLLLMKSIGGPAKDVTSNTGSFGSSADTGSYEELCPGGTAPPRSDISILSSSCIVSYFLARKLLSTLLRLGAPCPPTGAYPAPERVLLNGAVHDEGGGGDDTPGYVWPSSDAPTSPETGVP